MENIKIALKSFFGATGKGIAIIALVAIVIFTCFLIFKKSDGAERIRRAYGKITNPKKAKDDKYAGGLRAALDELYRD